MGLEYEADGTPYVVWNGHKIQPEREPLTDISYIEKAEKELRETPENVEKALKELRELLKDEINLVVPIDDDAFLMKFLRPCKFYAESAFKKIQAYYKFRQTNDYYCKNLKPSAVRLAFDHSIVSILSPRDQHGRRTMLVECGDLWNPSEVPLADVFRGVQLGLESAMFEPKTQVSGVSVILNMKGLSFTQIMQYSPMFAKMIVDWIQDCIPIRVKGIHIVNQPYIFNMLFAIFKPFLREKLRSRIFFHGADNNSLLQHIDGVSLMNKLGGELPDNEISGEMMWTMLHFYEERFTVSNAYGYISSNNK